MKKTEQEQNDEFVKLVGGRQRANRCQQIWNDSYPHGIEYDKFFNKANYRSKTSFHAGWAFPDMVLLFPSLNYHYFIPHAHYFVP